MHKFAAQVFVALIAIAPFARVVQAQETLNFPSFGGMAMLPDGNTLVLTVPSEAKIAYIDTAKGKEMKRVEVDFQPQCIVVQGDRLIVSRKGSSFVYLLDAKTCKEIKHLRLPGDPVQALACHPRKDFAFATNTGDNLLVLDFEKEKVIAGKARGQLLAVDAAEGKYVYSGIQKPIRDVVLLEDRGEQIKVSLATTNLFAMMLKYAIHPDGTLKLVAMNDNAAVNGRALGICPDGKMIAMAGGGGWRAKNDPRANYSVAVFETSDMKTQLGMIETGAYPIGVTFHPRLNIAAVFRDSANHLVVVNSKSLVQRENIKIPSGGGTATMTWGANGTVAVVATMNGDNPSAPPFCVLNLVPLQLSPEEKQTLKKGK